MTRGVRNPAQSSMENATPPWQARTAAGWWSQHREASLNWLALGLLLAAWNASDDDPVTQPRPEALRGYPYVSVRAAILTGTNRDTGPSTFLRGNP